MDGNKYLETKANESIERVINEINRRSQRNIVRKFNIFMATQGIMPKTRENYINKIKLFLNQIDKNVVSIRFDDYVSFMSSQLEKSSSYQVQFYTALKNFSEYLYTAGVVKKNYIEGVKRPKSRETLETKEKRDHNYLTEDEMMQFLTNVKNGTSKYSRKVNNSVRDYFLFQLMLSTGLRVSAIVKLDLSNIDREHKKIQVTEKRGKIRTCCMCDQLVELLDKWLEVRENEYNPVDEALFVTRNGTRLTKSAIEELVEKYGDGIKDFKLTPHKLRATYGTMIYEKTGDIYLTQQCMGHSNVQTTMLYVRGQEEKAQRQAAEIMSEVLF